MKKLLVASTALVLVAGAAVAEVQVVGNGRMGVVHNTYKVDGNKFANGNADGWDFNSRIRIQFNASGETDGGLAFGGSMRVDHGNAVNGGQGNVWISGAFGKLSMGDVDSAAEAAVGNLLRTFPGFVDDEWDHVGYVGAGAAANNPVALYEYAFGDTTVYASLADGNSAAPGVWNSTTTPVVTRSNSESYGVGVKHVFGDFTVAAGYEANSTGAGASKVSQDELSLGVTAVFGDLYVKAIYQDGTTDRVGARDTDWTSAGLGLEYQLGQTKLIGYYNVNDAEDAVGLGKNKRETYGIGASYDLGGGASVIGGINRWKDNNTTTAGVNRVEEHTRAQVGLSFTF